MALVLVKYRSVWLLKIYFNNFRHTSFIYILLIEGIQTIDGLDLGDAFLIESQPPGSYEERISIKAEPDPDCDPSQDECEQWLPGLYIVNIGILNYNYSFQSLK